MRKLISAAVAVAALVCVPTALAASSPTVSAGAATSIAETSAVLHGTVNPNGLVATYQFHYGPTTALGSVVPAAPASAGAGSAAVAKAARVGGLSPDTTYYYQLVASNSAGSSSTPIESFKTTGNPAPVTTTSPAVGVSRYGATLVGVINPDNQATSYHFDFGLTTAYGLQTATQTLPAGAAPVAISIPLPGLQPGQVYHYRLVASHGATSTTYGADEAFQTPPWPRPHTKLRFALRRSIARRAPYVYSLSGAVTRTATVPEGYGCHGTVGIWVYQGHRRLAFHNVPIGLTTCTYRSTFRFHHIRGRGASRLRIKARYFGDMWDAPSNHSETAWAR